MTPNEIRNLQSMSQHVYLQEIAAQLAELNQRLDEILGVLNRPITVVETN